MTHHDVMRHIDFLVGQVGWAVIKIVPTGEDLSTSYAYTVGLTEHGLPELLISGLDPQLSQDLLNDLARRVHGTTQRFTHLQTIGDLLRGFDAVIIDGAPTDALHAGLALARYGAQRVRLQQVVWPDPQGRFPWQPGSTITAHAQPLLSHPTLAALGPQTLRSVHGPSQTMPDVAGYARRILAAIDADVLEGILPAGVRTFTDLHDHVDANDYLDEAGVPYEATVASNEVTAAVQDAVTALLSTAGRPFCTFGTCSYPRHDHTTLSGSDGEELPTPAGLRCPDCGHPAHIDRRDRQMHHDDPAIADH